MEDFGTMETSLRSSSENSDFLEALKDATSNENLEELCQLLNSKLGSNLDGDFPSYRSVLVHLAIENNKLIALEFLVMWFGADVVLACKNDHAQDARTAALEKRNLDSSIYDYLINLQDNPLASLPTTKDFQIDQENPIADPNNINVKFFVSTKTELPFSFTSEHSSTIRTHIVLRERLRLLTEILNHIKANSGIDDKPLNILVCPEDFFQGGELYDENEREYRDGNGTCLDRDIIYHFFATQMCQLSKKYPNVLLIPGSAYISILAADKATYDQDGAKITYDAIRKEKLYVQNVVPIFFNGGWIRLIKKGGYLLKTPEKILITTAEEHRKHTEIESTIKVTGYGEDNLASMRNDLVFLGLTPLPNETALLEKIGIKDLAEFHQSVFSIQPHSDQTISMGVEICRDHGSKKIKKLLPEGSILDFHIIVTDGMGFSYSLATNGYSIRSDAEHAEIYFYDNGEPKTHVSMGGTNILCKTNDLCLTKKSLDTTHTKKNQSSTYCEILQAIPRDISPTANIKYDYSDTNTPQSSQKNSEIAETNSFSIIRIDDETPHQNSLDGTDNSIDESQAYNTGPS